MFKSLRWRLTIWFICLSTLIYAALTGLGMIIFHAGLTAALDQELHALSAEIRPAVLYAAPEPTLSRWASGLALQSSKLLATVQIYGTDGTLLESYGPGGIERLSLDHKELKAGRFSVRIRSGSLKRNNQLIGFLQTELSTEGRDNAVRQFGLTMVLIAPLLLLSSGIAGYFLSGIAAQPVEESFRVLRQFMGDAGHELGTPLSIIQANSEALENELPEIGQAISKLEVIQKASNRMGKLIKDLILLAKLESPQLASPQSPVALDDLVRNTNEEFSELFKAKEINLVLNECQPAVLMGDKEALKRLYSNLLQNALRYTEKGGRVTTDVILQGRHVKLCVGDSGIGIAPDKLPFIFDRFYRIEQSRSRAAGGSGLGLSIVRASAEAHNGRVEVQSRPGAGTIFTVTLPLHSLSETWQNFFARLD